MPLTKVDPKLLGGGAVLQVVQATYNTNGSTTSTSYVDTGLSATITPSAASSKILAIVCHSLFIGGSNQGQAALLNLVRGSTQVWETVDQGVQTYDQGGAAVEVGAYISFTYLDSPATTSATTYKTQAKRSSGNDARWRSGTLTLIEIAG